jgi:predicted porin
MNIKTPIAIALAAVFSTAGVAYADDTSDLKAKLQMLQNQIDSLKAQMDQMSKAQQAAPAAPAATGNPLAGTSWGNRLIQESEIYGNLDVSLDAATKGLQGSYLNGGTPTGHVGWQPDVSTNISYVGWRGRHALDDTTGFVWQLETQIDISATAGVGDSSSAQSNTVKGALTSRNSFVGVASDTWGAVKIGKTDAPYKQSTAVFNPFSGQIGDYSVIMGNTGGDNRVEFGTRLDHAIWYESPNFSGFRFNFLVAPGQNRTVDDNGLASGESDCAGGNSPGSGALPPQCNDGSYGTALSTSLTYTNGPFYATVAYELHKQVNRVSDTIGFPTTPAAFAAIGDPNDVGDEAAAKIGALYKFPTKTTVGFIYEHMTRDVPAYLEYQNERQRNGEWFFVSQDLSSRDVLSFGWAHAGKAVGDPGQHNTGATAGLGVDNVSNMLTLALRHQMAENTWWYVDYATSINHTFAHYDLGAGGRGVTTDCHDGTDQANVDVSSGAATVTGAGPHCFAGGHLQGVSVGLDFKF